jgi:hypothetical protein
MSHSAHQSSQPSGSSDPTARYTVGTLTYTKMGLVSLFAWLLWGDFCFQVMESLNPAIIPLKLRSLDAPNWAFTPEPSKLENFSAFGANFRCAQD